MALVELRGIGKSVATPDRSDVIRILDGVDLDVDAGQTVAIQGRSGSGKSTLLSILGLLDNPTQGSLRIAGRDAATLRRREIDRLRAETFGFVFQRFCLLRHLSALENVELALANRGIRSRQRRALAGETLERVGLGDRAGHRPAHLSGGEQQRVALARAMVTGAPVLLADEPTGSLDQATAADVIRQIHAAAVDRGRALVVVTHDDGLADGFDRRYLLADGAIREAVRC